ncbi:MAG: hypothetical protein ABEI77_10215 [Halorientalis sp.]
MVDWPSRSSRSNVRRGLPWITAGAAMLAVLVALAAQMGTPLVEAARKLFLPVVLLLWGVESFLNARDAGDIRSATTLAGALLFAAGALDLAVFFLQWPTADGGVVDFVMLAGLAAYLYSEFG